MKRVIEKNSEAVVKKENEIDELSKAPKLKEMDTKRVEEQIVMKEQELEEVNDNLDKACERLQVETLVLKRRRDDLEKVDL